MNKHASLILLLLALTGCDVDEAPETENTPREAAERALRDGPRFTVTRRPGRPSSSSPNSASPAASP